MNLTERPRRLRKSGFLRELVAENRVTVNDFITPLFITAGSGIEVEISSMPGYFKRSLDLTVEHAKLPSRLWSQMPAAFCSGGRRA